MRRLPSPQFVPIFAIAALVLGVLIPAAAQAAPGMVLGSEQDGGMDNGPRRELVLDTQQAIGSKVIRLLLRYDRVAAACDPARSGVAATSPANPCYDFSTPDAVVKGAEARGMKVLFSIYGAPKWEFGQLENWTGGSDAEFAGFTADYSDFATAAATRYDGRHGLPRVNQWTIWNEPNGSFFQPRMIAGVMVGPGRYAHLYDSAARRIKAVDPSLLVAVGPTAPHAASLPPVTFAKAALPVLQQLGSPIDAWAHNAYMGAQSPLHSTIAAPFVGLGNLQDLTSLMDQYSVTRGKPIWVTEFGYQTAGAQKAVDIAQQANLANEAIMYASVHPRITTFIWYSLHDDEDTGGVDSFQSGLFYPASRTCGAILCAKPIVAEYLHTMYVSPSVGGMVTLWAQGRMAPSSTQIYIQRPGDGWRAYKNVNTAETGTVSLRMKLPIGTKVMSCDVRCGTTKTVVAGLAAAGGGGTSGVKIQKLKAVRLGKAASLRSGIMFGLNCRCKASSKILVRGKVVGSSRLVRSTGRANVIVRFTASARRAYARPRTVTVILRTYIVYSNGSRAITDRPVVLR
jgi:hypothetical protein